MTTRTIASVALIAALMGCDEEFLTLEEFAERSPALTCAQLRECYGDDLIELFSADCETDFGTRYLEMQLPRLQGAVEAGTLVYDGTVAHACLRAIDAAGCGIVDHPALPACDEMFTGTVASGGACSIDPECEGDTFCQIAAGSCGGSCQAVGSGGSSCTIPEGCQDGLECYAGVCRTPAGVGAPCQGAEAIECAGGLICAGALEGAEPTPGECQTIATALSGGLGDGCDLRGGPYCQPGLSCALVALAGTTPTFECVGGSSPGGACHLAFPDACPSGEGCDATPLTGGALEGTCQTLPSAGEPCLQGGRCAANHGCFGDVCRAVQHVGGACTLDGQCFSGRCDGTICVERAICE